MMAHYLACSDMGIEVNHIQIYIIPIFSKVPDSPIVMGQFQVFLRFEYVAYSSTFQKRC